jgi:peptidyl-prolyl cis-trans isomerase SurA
MRKSAAVLWMVLAAGVSAGAQEKGHAVEEIVARVNNEIITRSDYEKALAQAVEETQQECVKCTPEQMKAALEEKRKNTLRDLIDQSLLVQRGKDMGVSVETDLIKRLDELRQQNNLASMEEMEKAVTAQGLNWEDFKSNMRNGLLTHRVIGSEVGSHIQIDKDEVAKYYQEHMKDFVRPEQVVLRELFVTTEGKNEAEKADQKKKADGLLERVKNGEEFGELAKRFSDGSTAKQNGYLGTFKRGELAKELEDKVFALKKNGLTDVMETKQGYLFLQVMEHYDEGQQTQAKVEPEITEKLYGQRMEPALRNYLKTLREQSYVIVKPGYTDTAGLGNAPIEEVNSTPEELRAKKMKRHRKFLLF